MQRVFGAHGFWLAWSVLGIAVCLRALAVDGLEWWMVAMLMSCTFAAGARVAWLCPR